MVPKKEGHTLEPIFSSPLNTAEGRRNKKNNHCIDPPVCDPTSCTNIYSPHRKVQTGVQTKRDGNTQRDMHTSYHPSTVLSLNRFTSNGREFGRASCLSPFDSSRFSFIRHIIIVLSCGCGVRKKTKRHRESNSRRTALLVRPSPLDVVTN